MLNHFYNCQKSTKKLILCVTPWDLISKEYKLNNNDYSNKKLIVGLNHNINNFWNIYYPTKTLNPYKKLLLNDS